MSHVKLLPIRLLRFGAIKRESYRLFLSKDVIRSLTLPPEPNLGIEHGEVDMIYSFEML